MNYCILLSLLCFVSYSWSMNQEFALQESPLRDCSEGNSINQGRYDAFCVVKAFVDKSMRVNIIPDSSSDKCRSIVKVPLTDQVIPDFSSDKVCSYIGLHCTDNCKLQLLTPWGKIDLNNNFSFDDSQLWIYTYIQKLRDMNFAIELSEMSNVTFDQENRAVSCDKALYIVEGVDSKKYSTLDIINSNCNVNNLEQEWNVMSEKFKFIAFQKRYTIFCELQKFVNKIVLARNTIIDNGNDTIKSIDLNIADTTKIKRLTLEVGDASCYIHTLWGKIDITKHLSSNNCLGFPDKGSRHRYIIDVLKKNNVECVLFKIVELECKETDGIVPSHQFYRILKIDHVSLSHDLEGLNRRDLDLINDWDIMRREDQSTRLKNMNVQK